MTREEELEYFENEIALILTKAKNMGFTVCAAWADEYGGIQSSYKVDIYLEDTNETRN